MAVANLVRAQIRLNDDSGLPEDAATWTFHFRKVTAGEPNESDCGEPAQWLQTFLLEVDQWIGVGMNQLDTTLTMYRLTDAKPRQPAYTATFASLTFGSDAAPRELALCGSYKGAYSSGEPPARRRGRVYIGPLATNTMSGSSGRPTSTFVTSVKNAMNAMLTSSLASAAWRWIVYSPTYETSGGGLPYIDVNGGWVDNEWDIQRRRGLRPTTKTLFP